MDYLKQKYHNNKLFFFGKIKHLQNKNNFQKLIDDLYSKNWVVFSKPSFANPEFVIEYLGRYTNKVAISNHRIIKIKDDKVTFKYKDYSDDKSWQKLFFELTGKDLSICPECGGNMTPADSLDIIRPSPA